MNVEHREVAIAINSFRMSLSVVSEVGIANLHNLTIKLPILENVAENEFENVNDFMSLVFTVTVTQQHVTLGK